MPPDINIDQGNLAGRIRRPRFRFSLLSFLLFICFAGATIGMLSPRARHEWNAYLTRRHDFAALQGTWESENGCHRLVFNGDVVMASNTGLCRPLVNSNYLWEGHFQLHTANNPKYMVLNLYDCFSSTNRGSHEVWNYEIQGDRLVTTHTLKGIPSEGDRMSDGSPLPKRDWRRVKTPTTPSTAPGPSPTFPKALSLESED